MNPTIAAAAWLILTGQAPAQTQVPLPTEPQRPVVIDCPVMVNHLTVRWVGGRHHHHHRHGDHR